MNDFIPDIPLVPGIAPVEYEYHWEWGQALEAQFRFGWSGPRCCVCGKRVPGNSIFNIRDVITGNVVARFCSRACVRERNRQNESLDFIER